MTGLDEQQRSGARRPPASTDVARLAGVSQKTVSRVMNNEPMVSAKVRERVMEAARELGYRPNSAARALTSGRTHRIGFVSLGTTLHGPVATLVAAEQAARLKGFSMSITTTSAADPGGVERAIDVVLQQGAEGIVLSEPIDCGEIDLHLEVPVLIFGHFPGLQAPHVISIMNAGDRNGEIATDHLLSLGHRTVHHISGPNSWYATRERRDGWQRALDARGAEVTVPVEGDWTAASGYQAAQVLARQAGVTAIFCANDDMALGAIKGLVDAGRSVPGDVSVIGFDDVPLAAYSQPALTTIRNPFEAGSSRGIEALISVIEDPDQPTPDVHEPRGELIVRESTGPVPSGGLRSRLPGGGERP